MNVLTSLESNASLSLAIWSSTSAFIGYRTNALTAAGRESPSLCFGEYLVFPLLPNGSPTNQSPWFDAGPQLMASLNISANKGKRNDSVFPEPVPEVITVFLYLREFPASSIPAKAFSNMPIW